MLKVIDGLVQVAGIIQKYVRRSLDHVARYGGEEFLVILPRNEREGSPMRGRAGP